MKLHKTITLIPLLSFAILALGSCQAIVQSAWTPRTALPGEEIIRTPATIVSASRGLGLVKHGSVHITTTFCKFCTDAGKTYRGDLMPLLVSHPAYGSNIFDATRELPYRKGQKGMLMIGSQSGMVHSFVPDEYVGAIEQNLRAGERWRHWQMRAGGR